MRKPVTNLTTRFVAEALDLPPSNYAPREFTAITSDTRNDVMGSLFVAIRGEHFDGHRFIDAAIAGGAAGIVAERDQVELQNCNVAIFPVDDTLAAWRRIAGAWRQYFTLPVVAIGGAAGKTTTKNLLAAMLRGKFRHVLATSGSQNGYLGLAMTLTALRQQHEAAVVEIGIDARGAMAEHAALVRPDAAVVTTVGAEHLETLGDIETVAAEEGRLLEWTAANGGDIFVHEDDPWLTPYSQRYVDKRCIRYKLNDEPFAAAAGLHGHIDGQQLVLSGLGLEGATLPLPLVGRHNALNVLAAAAIALQLGLDVPEVEAGLATFQPDAARSNVVALGGGITVLADYYNASPVSVAAALQALAEIDAKRRWVCLADMLELGPDELNWHRNLAAPIMASGAHGVLVYGRRMAALRDALQAAGFRGELAAFDDKAALADRLSERLASGDVVLIKGSRGMAMEEVMSRLTSHFGTES
ncbi:MAG TPA: UDP-N-acetylmuramoyl-tripeptide--D-alanyl-D-alanine ligase [Gammaproteobacteria bacterium]|nr:UDP-N-acetylmuramoyl-tripeptide--D-alanyl-D-alanine ligase [Gammaproteobacteria bacterium]